MKLLKELRAQRSWKWDRTASQEKQAFILMILTAAASRLSLPADADGGATMVPAWRSNTSGLLFNCNPVIKRQFSAKLVSEYEWH